jgi:sugar phosphate isomerase/epimerase
MSHELPWQASVVIAPAALVDAGGIYSIDGFCLGAADEAKRGAAVERMIQSIDLAVELGGADVVIGLVRGRYEDGGSRATYLRQYRRSGQACIDHATRKGVTLVHEAIGRFDSDVLKTIDENIVVFEYRATGDGVPAAKAGLDYIRSIAPKEDR